MDGLVGEPEYFSYLRQSGCYTVDGINDVNEWKDTMQAMVTMQMTSEEQDVVIKLVAAASNPHSPSPLPPLLCIYIYIYISKYEVAPPCSKYDVAQNPDLRCGWHPNLAGASQVPRRCLAGAPNADAMITNR